MQGAARREAAGAAPAKTRPLTIGLISNMSIAALPRTEAQFRALLAAGARGRPVTLLPFTLRNKNEMIRGHMPFEALSGHAVDALIVTGMEPSTDDLRTEWIWPKLTRLHDWAEQRSIPVIWSCLAAHAAVLHRDGITRQKMPEKVSGVFGCKQTALGHRITAGLPQHWHCPHSRQNGLSEEALLRHGYMVLSRSKTAGVDIFARQGETFSLYLQGHLEYQRETLLREYLRDLRRYCAGESALPPALPLNYFDPETERELASLQGATRDEVSLILPAMLACAARAQFRHDWSGVAAALCANWLTAVAEHAAETAGAWWPAQAGAAHAVRPGVALS